MKKPIVTKSLMLGTLFGLAGLAAAPADAATRYLHSAVCHYHQDDAGTSISNAGYLSTTAGRGIYCPVDSDSTLNHASVSTLLVDGYEPSGVSSYTKACVKSYSGTTTSCGVVTYWTTNGASVADLSAWTGNSTWYPYTYSYLGGSGSRLHGMTYF